MLTKGSTIGRNTKRIDRQVDTTMSESSYRDATGRFLKGCPGGPGNPHSAKVGEIRNAMLECVDGNQFKAVWRELVWLCLNGKGKDKREAIHEYLDRVLGKAKERIELDVAQAQSLDLTRYSDDQLSQALAILEPQTVKCQVRSESGSVQYAIPQQPGQAEAEQNCQR